MYTFFQVLPIITDCQGTMPRAVARAKGESFKNLKLDADFFARMLSTKEGGPEDLSCTAEACDRA